MAEGLGEGRTVHVSGGEAEGGGEGGERVGAARGGEVEGDCGRREGAGEVGVVGLGPEGECGPVVDGVGDDAGLVWVHEVSKELKWGWRGF